MDRAEPNFSLVRRLAAIASASTLAAALLGLSAAAVLAGPESGVDVVVHDGTTESVAPGDPPTACTFHLHFTASAATTGAFEIRKGDEDGNDVASGEFDTASGDGRVPATGAFELAEGSYTVIWDDELEMDRSFDEQPIEVVCGEAVVPPPPPPSSPPSVPPELPAQSASASPTGEELPVEGTPAPTPGGEEAPAGTVAGITVTPPPTDVADAATAGSSNVLPALVAVLGMAGVLLATTTRLHLALMRRRSERR